VNTYPLRLPDPGLILLRFVDQTRRLGEALG